MKLCKENVYSNRIYSIDLKEPAKKRTLLKLKHREKGQFFFHGSTFCAKEESLVYNVKSQ